MGEKTAISWTDMTFNPWIGCTKISPACDGCYAEAMMDKRYGRVQWGAPGKGNGTRVRTSAGNWRQPIRWNKKAVAEGTRPFVFCSSLADVFDNQVPNEWRRDLFDLIRATPHLVWLLLTKRPQLIVKLYEEAQRLNPDGTRWTSTLSRERSAWPRNAAIGTTVEDQKRADLNIPHLLHAKATLKPTFAFLSCEPLIAPIDLQYPVSIWPDGPAACCSGHECGCMGLPVDPPLIWGIDWVITGGETDQGGHNARPTHPDWYRGLRDQCRAAGVAYHHKQNGEFSDFDHIGMAWNDLPDRIRGQQQFVNGKAMIKVGKHRSGRLLDGVEHNARPQVAA